MKENDMLKKRVAEIETEIAELRAENERLRVEVEKGEDWFNEFQTVQDFMFERDLWKESDIGEKPSDALIKGIDRLYSKRNKIRVGDEQKEK